MDKYVFHSNFCAIDMDDVDIVLGYPWMDSIGTVNINVQKKFLNLWYKKMKITLQDISLSKQEVSTRKLVVAPTDTLDEDSMVESEEETIEEHEKIPQQEHGNEEDPIEAHKEMPQC